jgi:hypothetical protein
MYVLVVGYSKYYDDGIWKVFGPFATRQEAEAIEYEEKYSRLYTEIFELTKEL